MTMAANGLAKLLEELGELAQIAGKKLAYYHTDSHPDGMPIDARLEEELADVIAACSFVIHTLRLNKSRVVHRARRKLGLFRLWHSDPENNALAVDAKPPIRGL